MSKLIPIEVACKKARDARDTLAERATLLTEEIEALKRRRLPGIRSAVAAVAEADAALMGELQKAPELFVSPRSMVLHGMKVGYKKGTGKIEFADEAAVVRLIRKHFPEQFEVLVKTTEKPVKKALSSLSVSDLKKLGVQVEDTGDVVFVADATSTVDKLVATLLKGVEDEQEAEEATA